jgi:phosphoesterase RecJ-like protein
LTNLFREFDLPVTPQIASMLLVGIVTDCGCFRFNNTTSRTMQAAAWLMEQGGDYHLVMKKMYFSEPINKMRLQGKVLETLTLSHSNRVAHFFVTDELLKSCGATQDDAENLVDTVRCIEGVEIVCRMQQLDESVRFSLRSINPSRPIIGLAKEIGGGGHALAAGATMENATLKSAEVRFLELVGDLFND